jgi:hypothetical protein
MIKMKRGFLNQPSKQTECGLLQDTRSKLPPRWDPNGGWETNKYEPPTSTTETKDTGGTSTCTTSPTTEISESTQIPILKGPLLPQCLKQPKQAIQVWYARNHKQLNYRANEYFQSWDFGPPHAKYFTSIFNCPVTGEIFLSGTFGDPTSMMLKEEAARRRQTKDDGKEQEQEQVISVCWYRKKKDAENAAAARALDSLTYRDGSGVKHMSYGLCKEEPYLFDDGREFLIPSSAPEEVSDEIMVPVQILTKEGVKDCEEMMDIEEDSEQFRDDYRSIRRGMETE